MSNSTDLCKGWAFIHNWHVVLHKGVFFIYDKERDVHVEVKVSKKNPCQATVKAENKSPKEFNMRGCADQQDDALKCCSCTEDKLHFQV